MNETFKTAVMTFNVEIFSGMFNVLWNLGFVCIRSSKKSYSFLRCVFFGICFWTFSGLLLTFPSQGRSKSMLFI